jgi:hypothetical protein
MDFFNLSPDEQEAMQRKVDLTTNVRGSRPKIRMIRSEDSYHEPYTGPYGEIGIGAFSNNEKSAIAHEMAHSVDTSLDMLYKHAINNPDSKLAKQFVKAYDQLGPGTRQADARRLSPDWYDKSRETKWGRYRTSPRELTGWGAGNSMSMDKKPEHTRGGLHVDPTMNTHLEILKDIGARYVDEVNKHFVHEMDVPKKGKK